MKRSKVLQKSLYWVNECRLLQSTSLVLSVKIPNMDGIALRQIIDRIPLLKYRYFGSFPSDRVPMLPNDTFAIVNTEPSYMSGEHWVMIAKFKQQLYFADSLGESCNFLKQGYQNMVPVKLQSHPSVCGFFATYSAFHLFKFHQEQLTGVHDVNVLSFMGNYM